MPRFKITSTETVRRTYEVEAPDEKEARKRLNWHWDDPQLLRDGIVTQTGGEQVGSRKSTKIEPLRTRASTTAEQPTKPNARAAVD